MSMKYEITNEQHPYYPNLRRIKALRDIPMCGVKAGDLGGFVESEKNLSQYGHAWVGDHAQIAGHAWVGDHAQIAGHARVYDHALITGHAWVSGYALIAGHARISGQALIDDHAWITGHAWVSGQALIAGHAWISGQAHCQLIGVIEYRQVHIIKQADGSWKVQCGCQVVEVDKIIETANKLRSSQARNTEVYDLHVKHIVEAAKMHTKIHDHKEKQNDHKR